MIALLLALLLPTDPCTPPERAAHLPDGVEMLAPLPPVCWRAKPAGVNL